MCRYRFTSLFRSLHFNNNANYVEPGQPDYDKLFKVRPVIDRLNAVWKRQWKAGWAVSVDEMMVPFKGRTHLRQYMPAKIVKWGFKLWAICDGQSGFCLQCNPYAGKRPGEKSTSDLGGKVVRELASHVDAGSCIFADNFFSSPHLCTSLQKEGKFYVGTVRPNRKEYPKMVVLSCLVLSCVFLSCLVLSCLVLSCFVLS
jgi:hypothetical protein